MNIQMLLRRLALSAALVGVTATSARGEDIDIFAAGNGSAGGVANVLLIIDNAANFSANASEFRCSISPAGVVDTTGNGQFPTQLDGKASAVEQCALYSALQKLRADAVAAAAANKPNREFNIAVMGFNDNSIKSIRINGATPTVTFGRDCVGSVGGCLMMPFTRFNNTNAPAILDWIRNWDDNNSGIGDPYIVKTNNNANGAVMQEAWAYLYGRKGVSGRDYSSIAPPENCGGKSIIFVGNAYNVNASPGDRTNNSESPRLPFEGTASDTAKNASPAATPKQREIIRDSFRTICEPNKLEVLKDDEGRGIYALNWAAYMRAQGVVTFSIGILGPNCSAEYAAHLEKLGSLEVGGGGFFPTTNFTQLTAAFSTAINQIIAVNTAFASVSLPVSVNTQGAFLNQVFIGQFRPDQLFLPRWFGNLKQYRMAEMSNSLRLVDSVGTAAINTVTGFIDGCARSYWGPVSANSYWPATYPANCVTAFSTLSAAAASDASAQSDTPDGGIVEKGGQAFVLRNITPANRNAKTCTSASNCVPGSLTDFSSSVGAVTSAVPAGTAGPAITSADLVDWARGLNVRGEIDKGLTVMRPSVHGDVVHSRPVAVNYGTDDAPNIVVFYGANDGFLRAVNGNQTAASVYGSTSYPPGAELWSFMPFEFYSKLPRLFYNSQGISLPTGSNDGRAAKDYGMDGAVTAFQGSVTRISGTVNVSGNKKYLFATMRRGGRAIYAFDVTSPASPSLLWRKGCDSMTSDTGCSTGFTALGQTWSAAKTMYAAGYDSGNNPLVIMGGGYDPACEDVDSGTTTANFRNRGCTGTSASSLKGNRIFVLDGIDGSVVREFTTDRGVIGDVTIVAGSDGKARYAYAADLGGNVYRLTFTGASTAWTIRKIAELGCDDPSVTGCAALNTSRKFMFAPSVVTADGGLTYNILLGSGDREKPVRSFLATQSVQNYFFMLKDKPTQADWFDSEATLTGCGVGKALLCLRSLTSITAGVKPTDAALSAKKGWYLGLVSGEQVVTSALTLFGVTTFSTSQPPVTSTTTCTADLGTTLVYNVNYQNAFSATNEALPYARVNGGGLPPSPVGGLVLIDGKKVPFCIGCRAESPLESKRAGVLSDTLKPVGRSYWFIKQ